MKKKILLSIFFLIGSLTACQGKNVAITADDAKANEMIITADKKAQTVIKESFEKKYYKESDLKKFIEEDIERFNSQNSAHVKLNSMKVKEGNVYVVLDYANVEEMNKYNTDMSVTKLSVSEAKKYSLPKQFNKYGRDKKVDKSEVLSNKEYKVLLISKPNLENEVEETTQPEETVKPEQTGAPEETLNEEATEEPKATEVPITTKVNMNITVAGKILYTSNASKVDKNTAKIKTLDETIVIVYK